LLPPGEGYAKVSHLGETVDANFPSWVIDAKTKDPKYTPLTKVDDLTYVADDSPTTSLGRKRDYDFEMCLFDCSEVPKVATDDISFKSKAVRCLPWEAKVTHNWDGTITHP